MQKKINFKLSLPNAFYLLVMFKNVFAVGFLLSTLLRLMTELGMWKRGGGEEDRQRNPVEDF